MIKTAVTTRAGLSPNNYAAPSPYASRTTSASRLGTKSQGNLVRRPMTAFMKATRASGLNKSMKDKIRATEQGLRESNVDPNKVLMQTHHTLVGGTPLSSQKPQFVRTSNTIGGDHED